jgi:hypothetical protein
LQVIADLPKGLQSLFVCSRGSAWIPNAPVNTLGGTRKDWTLLGGVVADGDYRNKALAIEFGYGFGSMAGDIDPDFTHRLNSKRVHAYRPDSGAGNIMLTGAHMP